MSKKKQVILFLTVAFAAFALYTYTRNPQIISQTITYLRSGFNANPLGIIAAVGTAVSAAVGAARLAWSRAKSGYDATVNAVIDGKTQNINDLSDLCIKTRTQLTSMTGQLSTVKTELDTARTALTETQKKLADANMQLQKETIEQNAIAAVRAAELRLPKPKSYVE